MPKVAVHVLSLSRVTVTKREAPEQSPDQPAKVLPLAGVAMRVTRVP
jgi:hypothetical protein